VVTSPFSVIMRSDRSGGMVESPLTFKAGRYWTFERFTLSLSELHSTTVSCGLCVLSEMMASTLVSDLDDGRVISLG
jgi:hypothetical protein